MATDPVTGPNLVFPLFIVLAAVAALGLLFLLASRKLKKFRGAERIAHAHAHPHPRPGEPVVTFTRVR